MTVRLIEIVNGVEDPLVGTFPSETEAAEEAGKRQAAAKQEGGVPTSPAFPRYRIVAAEE